MPFTPELKGCSWDQALVKFSASAGKEKFTYASPVARIVPNSQGAYRKSILFAYPMRATVLASTTWLMFRGRFCNTNVETPLSHAAGVALAAGDVFFVAVVASAAACW